MGFLIFFVPAHSSSTLLNFLQIYHRSEKISYKFTKNIHFCLHGMSSHSASVEEHYKKTKLPLASTAFTQLFSLFCDQSI